MLIFESTRLCRIGFLAVACSCFFLGFLFEINFLSHNQHETTVSSFQNGLNTKNIGVDSSDLQRILDIETKYANQLIELDNLKALIAWNKESDIIEKTLTVKVPAVKAFPCTDTSTSSLLLSRVTNDIVPDIVKSWRAAKLDWHMLLPMHNSIWERFGTPEKGKGLRLLVSKEIQVTNFLTQFRESGLSANYGHDHGALLEYAGCNAFVSACMVHSSTNCKVDELCMWSSPKQLCVDRGSEPDTDIFPTSGRLCANPKALGQNGVPVDVMDASSCKFYVNQPAVFVSIDSESQSMFYHWWASWSSIVDDWKGSLKSSRQVHYFVHSINDPMFFDFFGLISNNCWRRATPAFKQAPVGACFCNTKFLSASQSRSSPGPSSEQLMEFLEIGEVKPPHKKIKVGIISRRLKRFILNEYDLVAAVESMGFQCVLLPLETMTMYEQMRELRSLDVMIGIHGSGLDNSVFLHEGSVMVQLLPYKVEHRCTFRASAESAGVIYQEWQLTDPSKAVFHWDLLIQANKEKLVRFSKEEILEQGQVRADSRETLMFWINQDIIVPLDEWETIVKRAIKASKASGRGIKV